MKDFIEYLVKELVSKPTAVSIDESKEEENFIYTIHVDSNDMGSVIGKDGRIIRSVRNLAKAKAIKDNVRIQITIAEEE